MSVHHQRNHDAILAGICHLRLSQKKVHLDAIKKFWIFNLLPPKDQLFKSIERTLNILQEDLQLPLPDSFFIDQTLSIDEHMQDQILEEIRIKNVVATAKHLIDMKKLILNTK